MKKISIYILLFVIIIDTAGYLLFLKVHLYLIHKEIKYELLKEKPDKDCVLLSIPKNKQNALKGFIRIHSGEFRYKGEMYDVISQRDSAEVTIFRCIKDKEETDIFLVFSEILKQNHSDNKNKSTHHFPNIFAVYYIENIVEDTFIHKYTKVEYTIFDNYDTINKYYPPNNPPPIS